jgi:hypothetical protein
VHPTVGPRHQDRLVHHFQEGQIVRGVADADGVVELAFGGEKALEDAQRATLVGRPREMEEAAAPVQSKAPPRRGGRDAAQVALPDEEGLVVLASCPRRASSRPRPVRRPRSSGEKAENP